MKTITKEMVEERAEQIYIQQLNEMFGPYIKGKPYKLGGQTIQLIAWTQLRDETQYEDWKSGESFKGNVVITGKSSGTLAGLSHTAFVSAEFRTCSSNASSQSGLKKL